MANPVPIESSSMFLNDDTNRNKSPSKSAHSSPSRRSSVKPDSEQPAEVITVKDFFDFMKTAYQVYEHLEGDEEEDTKINWEELTKLTVINHVIEQQERNLLHQTTFAEPKAITSKSETALEKNNSEERTEKRYSCSELEGKKKKLE